ncbi:MAG: isoprenyl transferase [Parasporobacterium sp.]|nr:isoprenyl transferase [Parasporobacterium sp.]
MAEEMKIPKHLAIIMDGNGRWAKKRKMPRTYGHAAGAKVVEQICEDAKNLGIEYLTVYAFSTENWKRPEAEVKKIMSLIREYLKKQEKKMMKENMAFSVIGDRSRLDADIIETIDRVEKNTKDNTGLKFCVAINYGSRDEMVRAMRNVAKDVKEGKISESDINEELFSSYLDTRNYPDPDLLIRTSGEERLSNFLMWQLAYAEFYFTDVLWPDFNKAELEKAIDKYNKRDRRFGTIEE